MKKSISKNIQFIIVGFMLASCETQEILVPEIEFFLSKEWRLEEAYRGDDLYTSTGEDLSLYRLKLNEDFTYEKTDVFGQLKKGNWVLRSGLTQLILDDPNPSNAAHYLIIDLRIRRLELRQIPSTQSGGRVSEVNLAARYILVPVKGQ